MSVLALVGHSSGVRGQGWPGSREQWMQRDSLSDSCGAKERFSGLEHQGQRKGQPLRKATVRIPPPS